MAAKIDRADGNCHVWHQSDSDYAEVQVKNDWDVWQARRKAVRLGGDWEQYRRYPKFKKKVVGHGDSEDVVECKCGQCGSRMMRTNRSIRTSMRKAGLWCDECRFTMAGQGRKKQWLRANKGGRETAG